MLASFYDLLVQCRHINHENHQIMAAQAISAVYIFYLLHWMTITKLATQLHQKRLLDKESSRAFITKP